MQTLPRPKPLLAAAALVGLEGLLVAVLGGYLMVVGFLGDPDDTVGAEITGLLALATGAGLLLVARGLSQGRRWSRSPAVLTQIFCLPVGWSLLQGDRPGFGLPMIAVAVATLVLLFLPSTGAALEG